MKKISAIALAVFMGATTVAWADGYPDGTPGYLLSPVGQKKPAPSASSGGIQRKTWLPYRQGPIDEVQPQPVEPMASSDTSVTRPISGKAPIKCDGKTNDGWAATKGKTLQQILDSWSACTGWQVVWQTDLQYPLRSSALFPGDYVTATSNLIGAFKNADTPVFGQFHEDNKTLVITTPMELDGE